jgi:hypothetical protein
LCYALAAWAALAGLQTQGGRWFAAAGAASAAGYWIRPEGLSVAIVTAGLVLVRAVQAPAAGSAAARRRWAVGLASLTAATCLVAAPYVLLSGKVTGKLWNKQNLYPSRSKSVGKAQPRQVPLFDRAGPAAPVLGFASPAPLAIVDPQSVASVVAPLARAAWELVERSVSQLHLLLLLAALGCFWRRAARPQAQAVSLSRALGGFHVALLILLYLLGGYIDRRHLLPLAVLVVPWAACGLVAVSAWVSERMAARGRTWSPRFVTAGLLVVLLATMLPRSLRPLHEPYGPQLAAAAWIQRHTAGGEALVANSPYLGFYSGREFEVHGWSEYRPTAPLSDRIRTADARYIVLDTGASEHFDPAWLAALDGHYTLVQRIEGTGRARRHTVLIYEPTRTAERPPPSSL